jgi:hypothetical protein
MSTIGTFTKTADGFTGAINTLSLNVKSAQFRPNEKSTEEDRAQGFDQAIPMTSSYSANRACSGDWGIASNSVSTPSV